MTQRYVIHSFMMDRDDLGQIELLIDDKMQWLTDRNVKVDTMSHYQESTMCYRVVVVACLDRETYVEYKMVWE
jgi:hypothetical protein